MSFVIIFIKSNASGSLKISLKQKQTRQRRNKINNSKLKLIIYNMYENRKWHTTDETLLAKQ